MATQTTTTGAFWRGARDCGPFLLVAGPFGALFGVVGTEAGLNIAEVMGFSIVVIAGASQFAALSLMLDQAPTVIVLLSAIAVNLRMAMYSASLVPHLGAAALWQRAIASYMNVDQTYASSILEYERHPEMTPDEKMAYFFGISTPIVPCWFGFAIVGAAVGASIPPAFALDFALPIAFIAMVAPALRTLAHVAAAFTSMVMALTLAWVPSGLGLLIAAGCAMGVGALVETAMERRA